MVWNYCSRIVLYSVGGKELIIIVVEISLSHSTAIELQLLLFRESDLFHNWVMHDSSSGRNFLNIAVDFGSSEQDLDGAYTTWRSFTEIQRTCSMSYILKLSNAAVASGGLVEVRSSRRSSRVPNSFCLLDEVVNHALRCRVTVNVGFLYSSSYHTAIFCLLSLIDLSGAKRSPNLRNHTIWTGALWWPLLGSCHTVWIVSELHGNPVGWRTSIHEQLCVTYNIAWCWMIFNFHVMIQVTPARLAITVP